MERALWSSGVTFAEWVTLQTMEWLIAETGDAVSQSDVARRMTLTRATISLLMRRLDDKALVDRDCSASGPALRIWLHTKATRLLKRFREPIEAVSARCEQERTIAS